MSLAWACMQSDRPLLLHVCALACALMVRVGRFAAGGGDDADMDALTIALELSATYEQLSESVALVQTSMPGPQHAAAPGLTTSCLLITACRPASARAAFACTGASWDPSVTDWRRRSIRCQWPAFPPPAGAGARQRQGQRPSCSRGARGAAPEVLPCKGLPAAPMPVLQAVMP